MTKNNAGTDTILFPELQICDPHHHFFNEPDHKYMLDDLLQDLRTGHNVVRTVYIDCHSGYRTTGPVELQPVGETDFVVDLVSKNEKKAPGVKLAAGVVGFADLTLGEAVMPVLEAHLAAGKERFKGVRQVLAWDDNPASKGYNASRGKLAADKKFRAGFACLKKLNLSFDAMLFHSQLIELVDLALAFPDTTIILDHIGTPLSSGPYAGKQAEVFQDWKRGIAALGKCNNVYIKLGGFGMGIIDTEMKNLPDYVKMAEAAKPYVSWCLEQFGVRRCMFESNFPVDKRMLSYAVIWNAFKYLTKDLIVGEREALFHDNAVKAYRL